MSSSNVISLCFNQKQQKNVQDHVWVLFMLAEISKYFEEENLNQAAAVIEGAIFNIEDAILAPPPNSESSATPAPVL
ncbi:hypothetical protein [Falsiphaeobacter marinintestinus]|uniref:hypothetical protein n=1 Tax=Falsiphaeobacter marinintestinus TaxID=1492905 RepID=UPI0011B45C04|nr:hypothetical protein [Phaeobacter marinintestinus]